jgi:hypothetical protein
MPSNTSRIVIGLAAIAALMASDRPDARLNSKDLEILSAVRRSQLQGDALAVVEQLAPVYSAGDARKRAAIDEALADLKLPDGASLLGSARVVLARQGLDSTKLPRPSDREITAILGAVTEEIAAALALASDRPADDNAPPTSDLQTFDQPLWSFHVLENRLETAEQLSRYSAQLSRTFPRTRLAKLTESDRQLIQRDWEETAKELQQAKRRVEEREIRLRLDRLIAAREVLEQPPSPKQQLLAAYTSDFDARVIRQFLDAAKRERRTLTISELGERQFEDRVNAEGTRARKLAGPLTAKARLLFEGLHWWLRGRYGTGPEVGGLAKSPGALRSPIAQMALFMPRTTPSPTDPNAPTEVEQVPLFERRHHYWWAWEDRRLRHITPTVVITDGQSSNPFTATLTQFW